MRLHDRYLFRELLTPLALCLGAFVIFGISFPFFGQISVIQERKLNLLEALAYCAASLPAFFVVVLPVLLLLALLYALSQHARHHELTALRAAGISLWRLCLPYFAVGLVATGIHFALGEFAVPACNRWAAQILERHVKSNADAKDAPSRTKRSFSYRPGRRSWFFLGDYDAVNQAVPYPTVKWTQADGEVHVVQAERAVYTNGVWTFFNAQFLNLTTEKRLATNRLEMPEFSETPENIRLLLKFNDSQSLGGADGDVSLGELWELLRHNPGLRLEAVRNVQTQFWGRLATPWTCLVVVLIAIPFGAQTGRRNLFFGVAGSIFIVFGYIVLTRVSLAFGSNGQLPGCLAAWLPNLCFAALGVGMILRVR